MEPSPGWPHFGSLRATNREVSCSVNVEIGVRFEMERHLHKLSTP